MNLINCYILAKPEQRNDVMTLLYELQIFPMEYDPVNVYDFLENFDMSEKSGSNFRFCLSCMNDNATDEINKKLRLLPSYDNNFKLPRLEMEGECP